MRFISLLALGLGNLVFAQDSITSPGSPTPTPTAFSASPEALKSPLSFDGFPSQLGDFEYYGCVESEDRFPSFLLTGSTEDMSLDFCAASCKSRFFSAHNK